MKVIHFIASIDKSAGGITAYMQLLSKELIKNIEIRIATGFNGALFRNVNEMANNLEHVERHEIKCLGNNALLFVQENLSMDGMVKNALKVI